MSVSTAVSEYLQSCDLYRARIDAAAEFVGMSEKTLGRRLAQEGVKFHELRDAERKRRCIETLKHNPGATCHDLAQICGYSAHTTMCRTFPRWFGVNLREWKIAA